MLFNCILQPLEVPLPGILLCHSGLHRFQPLGYNPGDELKWHVVALEVCMIVGLGCSILGIVGSVAPHRLFPRLLRQIPAAGLNAMMGIGSLLTFSSIGCIYWLYRKYIKGQNITYVESSEDISEQFSESLSDEKISLMKEYAKIYFAATESTEEGRTNRLVCHHSLEETLKYIDEKEFQKDPKEWIVNYFTTPSTQRIEGIPFFSVCGLVPGRWSCYI